MENEGKSVNDLFTGDDLFSDVNFDSTGDEPTNQEGDGTQDTNYASFRDDSDDVGSGFDSLPGDNITAETSSSDSDVISMFLKEHNINPDGVLIDNERVPFNNLKQEEQLEILKSLNVNVNDPSLELDDSEIELLNSIRAQGVSPSHFLEEYGRGYTSNYIQSMQDESVTVADLTDDQLFLVDLQVNIPDITEEEAMAQLELEKSNESLFSKKVNSLRNDYLEKENFLAEQETLKAEQEYRERFEEYERQITDSIYKNKSIDLGNITLDMSNDDMNNVAAFILDNDKHGSNPMQRALEDPNKLVKMAWFALNGQEAFTQLDNYYKEEIQKAAKYNYEKGLNAAKGGGNTRSYTTNVGSNKSQAPKKNNDRPKSINDIWSV